MKSRLALMVMGLVLVLFCYSSAQVPQMINYQGKLATNTGAPVNDTLQIVFTIYADEAGTTPLWTETQSAVEILKGVFNVLLGSVNPISFSVFDGSIRYLGVKVGGDPEITPRKPMVSVAYAMKAGSLGDCHDCDTVFVNVVGPDSVVSTTGTAFRGAVYGSTGDLIGVRGHVEHNGSDEAYGGFFSAYPGGTGEHYGLYAEGRSDTPSPAYGAYNYAAHAEPASLGPAYGTYGKADNASSGNAYGGYFTTGSYGSGWHYGVYAYADAANWHAYGVFSEARSNSEGLAVGGYFSTDNAGTGTHFGIYADGKGYSSNETYGTYSIADNGVSGDVYGGYFKAQVWGTGIHYGIYAESYSQATSSNYGTYSYASNSTTGDCYAGYFLADDQGNGTDSHMGVRGEGVGSAGSTAYGVMGYGENTSTGGATGGHFVARDSGTGTHYGVRGSETAGGGGAAVYAAGDFAGTGAKYAVVKTGKGHRLLSCMESPEIWFEDFGEGQLVNGKAHIELDALFLETVTINADHPMKVFVQLKDDCKGTYVKTSNTGFDVNELQGGTSKASFSYRIVAKRKGYENERMRETDVGYDDPTLYPELQAEIDKAYQEEKQQQQLEREKRKQEEEQRREEQKKMEEERTRMEK